MYSYGPAISVGRNKEVYTYGHDHACMIQTHKSDPKTPTHTIYIMVQTTYCNLHVIGIGGKCFMAII